jgi:hypothetical protein
MVIDQRMALATNPIPESYYKFKSGVKWVPVEQAQKLAITQSPLKKPSPKVTATLYVLLLLPTAALLFFLIKTRRK